jgi:predicted phage terminase large subunit-like protein
MNLPLLQQLFSEYSPRDLLQAVESERIRRTIEAERTAKTAAPAERLPLADYIKEAWHVLEPNAVLKWGWALQAICDHLEAVTDGRLLQMGHLNRLLINVPPGMMKSLLVGVFWPSWEWGPAGMPWLSYLSTAYRVEGLSGRDTRKMRELIASEWWQERWGKGTASDVYLTKSGEEEFHNNHRGWRRALAFTGLTGGRADRVLVDDPHSTEQSESELERARAERIFRESLHSRINDPATSAIIIIMQRLHQKDVSGLALASTQRYIHIMLPMRFEAARKCTTPLFADPRTVEGELLFPERFPKETVDRDEGTMTAYAVAGQHQQRPGQREGNMFKRHWFKLVGAAPVGTRWVRFWDLAATEEKYSQSGTAQTAGVLMGKDRGGSLYIAGCEAEWVENHDPLILNTADTDRLNFFPYEVGLPQDPGQAGKTQKKHLATVLSAFNVRFLRESGDKGTRAEPLASQAEVGNVYLVVPPNQPLPAWAEGFIDQCCAFPGGALKDKVDAASGAYATLLKPARQDQGSGRPVPANMSIYAR